MSEPAASSLPRVSAEEAISSLCLHLQGFVLAASENVRVPRASLPLDTDLHRQAGKPTLADEVDELDAALSRQGVDVAVFLVDSITDAQRRAIGERLREAPGISRVDFETRKEAAARFREMFKDNPVFLENVDVRILPESWRASASEGHVSELADELRGMSGVRGVDLTPSGFAEAADEFLGLHRRVCQGAAP